LTWQGLIETKLNCLAVNLNKAVMNEIFYTVEESAEGGYEARELEHSIFTEADSLEELKQRIKEAVHCHFG